MSRDSRALPVKPRDDYKLWSPQPDPATIKPCPICSKRAEVWQYAAKPDSQLLRVVMCTNGEAFGPQVRDGGSLFSGCMLYMPPDDFYRATTKEAVRYWNEYAEAIAAQRSESAVRYERRPELDKRIANGDDFAGDAWVRWTVPGHTPSGERDERAATQKGKP